MRIEKFENEIRIRLSGIASQNDNRQQFNELLGALRFVEERLARLARRHSTDFWYPLLRRELLGMTETVDHTGMLLVTHTLLKHAPPVKGTADDDVEHRTLTDAQGRRHDHAIYVTEDFQVEKTTHSFWALIIAYRRIQEWMRAVGRGGRLRLDGEVQATIELDSERAAAIADYNERRLRDESFTDQGVMLRSVLGGDEYALSFAHVGGEKPGFEIKAWSGPNIYRFLRQYDVSLELQYGLGPEELSHVLVALSRPIISMMLSLGDCIEFNCNRLLIEGTAPPGREVAFETLKELARKGYARLPRDSIMSQIETTRTQWCSDPVDGRSIAERFFAAFVDSQSKAGAINLERGRGASIIFPAADGYDYIDYCHLTSFLAGLIDAAQEHLSGQHGDRFTALLAQRLREIDPQCVVGIKLDLMENGSVVTDVDILLLTGDLILCVECKALTESDRLFRGDSRAYEQRLKELRKAVKQAERARNALEVSMRSSTPPDDRLHGLRRAEHVACFIKAEYVVPSDDFGTLPEGLRRLCSMSELLEFVRKRTAEQSDLGTKMTSPVA